MLIFNPVIFIMNRKIFHWIILLFPISFHLSKLFLSKKYYYNLKILNTLVINFCIVLKKVIKMQMNFYM